VELPAGAVARPRTVRTFFGTILYADLESSRIRHCDDADAPRNLFLVQVGDKAILVRSDDVQGFVAVRLRPEGPHAACDSWTPWTGGGLAQTFTVTLVPAETPSGFTLRSMNLLACAEPDGEFTLSRITAGSWETFWYESDSG
jgi:hypothetical protein